MRVSGQTHTSSPRFHHWCQNNKRSCARKNHPDSGGVVFYRLGGQNLRGGGPIGPGILEGAGGALRRLLLLWFGQLQF